MIFRERIETGVTRYTMQIRGGRPAMCRCSGCGESSGLYFVTKRDATEGAILEFEHHCGEQWTVINGHAEYAEPDVHRAAA